MANTLFPATRGQSVHHYHDWCYQRLRQLQRQRAAIVTAGDNYQGGGCTPPYRGVYDYYPNYVTAPQAFWPVPGNHDYNDAPLSAYQSYFTWIPTVPDSGRRYYSKVLGDVEFFMVDSPGIVHDGGGIKDQTYFNVERNWLQSNMSMSKENGHQWQIVVLHYPPYTSATTHPSNTSLQWDYAAWGAEAVISGHDHVYERVMHDNIPYLTVGLGGQSRYSFGTPIPGSAVRYNSDYGALKLTATDTTLDFQFYSVSDGVVDNYQVQTLPVNPPNYRIFLPLAEMH
jgi:tartrate-resistant acid phosphatase type 5